MNDLVKGCNKTAVRFRPAPQDMKKLVRVLKKLFGGATITAKKKRIINVYSADTNKIDEDGGPYKVEVTNVQRKTR